MNKIKDKIKGMIYGEALGDALGAPHEFRNQKKNYNGKLDKPIITISRWQGQFVSAVGQITDDTEMTICLWNSLISNEMTYNKNDTIMNYLEWANTKGTWAMGKNTRFLFHGVKTIKGYENRMIKNKPDTQSNGAMMRCSPLAVLGYLHPTLWRDAAIMDNDITNPNDVNRVVNKIYIKSIILALKNKNKEVIYKKMLKLANKSKIQIIIDTIKLGKHGKCDIIKNKLGTHESKGWCIMALLATCWGLFQFKNYHTAIDAIIMSNGDTDTNAKIAGALLGAYYGLKIMESTPRTKRNIKIMMSCDVNMGDRNRPEIYQVQNIKQILSLVLKYFK